MLLRCQVVLFSLMFLALGQTHGQVEGDDDRPGSRNSTSAALRLDSWQRHQELKQASPYKHLEWRCVGPRMTGGRIEAIAAVPGKPSTLYVGAGSGGLWKTVNNGITWTPLFDDQPTQAIGDVAVAPSDPKTVWVGTGEVLLARSALTGMGVFKSTDAGATWQSKGLADTHHIGQILIDPTDPNVVYVAAIGHRSSRNAERGVFKTIDGGDTWTQSLFVDDTTSAMNLIIDAEQPNRLFCTTWQRDDDGQDHYGPQSGIYRSSDAGQTWTRLKLVFASGELLSSGRVAIAQAASRPSTIYALLDEAVVGDQPAADILCRSDDYGDTWRIVNAESLKAGWDWCEIRVSPDDSEELYSIGQKSYVSHDGGETFDEIGGTIVHLLPHAATSLHLDTHEMWIDPADPSHLVFGNDGGLFVSYDRGLNWLHVNTLPIAECYAVSYDSVEPYHIYVGTQDNAAVFGPSTHVPKDGGPEEWQHVYLDPWGGGDSYFTYRDPTDSDTIYYEHQYGELRRKNMVSGEVKSIKPTLPADQGPLRFAWMTPYFPSPHHGPTLYYGANRVFKSTDRGDSWTVISPDLTSGPLTPNLRYQAITTLAESPLQPGQLFAGTDNGNLFCTRDGGENWQSIDQTLPRCQVTRVCPSAHRQETVFVTLTGMATDDFSPYVFRSDDLGATWRSIALGLPLESINVIAEDPVHADILYLGTDLGVYVSTDGGETWHSLCHGLPAASVHDLFVHPQHRELVIGTHGRSVWLLNVEDMVPLGRKAVKE